MKSFQRLVGGLNWLSLCTRPEITVATRLLSSHNIKPSQGHYDSAKYVLQWLGGTRNFGIRFTQGGDFAKAITSWVDKPKGLPIVSFTPTQIGVRRMHPQPNLETASPVMKFDPCSVTSLLVWGDRSSGIVFEKRNHPAAYVNRKYVRSTKDANPDFR